MFANVDAPQFPRQVAGRDGAKDISNRNSGCKAYPKDYCVSPNVAITTL